ncbi:MAG: alpha/beta hydrolase [Micrococcales bacterium]|nr:alpha/beta hydrolase [Micrococcales bacterium]
MVNLDAITQVGQGRPLVLAHGAGGRVRGDFGHLIQRLKGTRRLVGYDYPGSGRNPLIGQPLTLDLLADSLVDAAGAAGEVTFPVLGYSLGAAVAVTAASRHPDRVTGLILTCGFAHVDRQFRAFSLMYQALLAGGDFSAIGRLLAGRVGPGVHPDPDEVRSREARVAQLAQGIQPGSGQQLAVAASVDLAQVLRSIGLPTLVIVAGEDQLVLPQTQRELSTLMPKSEMIEYPHCGHVISPAQGDIWARDISNFLERHHL